MDANVAEQLARYARGEITSRSVRDATGLDYTLVLGGLHELGLQPPLARLDGPDGAALRRGRDLVLAAVTARPRP